MNAEHWSAIAALALAASVLLVLVWALRGDDYRTRNDRAAATRLVAEERPEPDQPGVDDALLAACKQICPDLARKEDRP